MNRDLEQLRLLAIFHYVFGGLVALMSLIPTFYLLIGAALASGVFVSDATATPDRQAARFVGGIFVAVASVVLLFSLVFAALVVKAGRNLARQRGYTFALVIAALCCFLMPIGTVLGIFTLVVLTRDSVRELFEGGDRELPAT